MKLREVLHDILGLLAQWYDKPKPSFFHDDGRCSCERLRGILEQLIEVWDKKLDPKVYDRLDGKISSTEYRPRVNEWKIETWLDGFPLDEGPDFDPKRDARLLVYYSDLQVLLKYKYDI